MGKIFISYSHRDEVWKDRLVTHLNVLGMAGLLEVWEDRQIKAGDHWYAEIETAIAAADVAILLITKDFLTSPFVLEKEVPALLKRRNEQGLRVIPLVVAPCAWERIPWLGPIQARPKDGRPISGGDDHRIDQDLADLAEEIHDLLRKIATASPGPRPASSPPGNAPQASEGLRPDSQGARRHRPSDRNPGPSAGTQAEDRSIHLPGWPVVVSVVSGIIFLGLLLVIAVFIPNPTPFQIFVFRVVLALAAAAFGIVIPGFLKVEMPLWRRGLISAGGAMALFLIVYQVNPPALVGKTPPPSPAATKDITQPPPGTVLDPEVQPLSGTILDTEGEPLAGVNVTLVGFDVSGTTDSWGAFSLRVKGKKQMTVRIMARRDGLHFLRKDVTLGNTKLSFKMERKQ